MAGPRLPARRHRRLDARRQRRSTRRSAGRASRRSRDADVVLFVVDATVGVTEEDARVADLLRRLDRPVFVVANKVDDASREAAIWEFLSLGLGEPVADQRAARPRHRRPARPARRSACPSRRGRRVDDDRADDATRSRAGVRRGASSGGPTSASRRCSTGSSATTVRSCTTCPAPPATAIDTVVETDDGPDPLRRHRGHAPQVAHRRGHRVLLVRPRAAGGRPRPTSRCSSSTPPRASPTRTSAWPSASTPPAARSWSCSTSGSCSTPTARADVDYQVGQRARTSSATRVVLKICALTGKGVHRLLPALAEAIEAYHTRVPDRGRSTT